MLLLVVEYFHSVVLVLLLSKGSEYFFHLCIYILYTVKFKYYHLLFHLWSSLGFV